MKAVRRDRSLDALLIAAGRSDVTALSELYDALAPRVMALTERIVGDREQAEEVGCDVFVEAWRCASSFDPQQTSALAWIIALTHRRAVHHLRCHPGSGSPEDRAGGFVPDAGARPVLELAYYRGWTYREVAQVLGLAPGEALLLMRTPLTTVDSHRAGYGPRDPLSKE